MNTTNQKVFKTEKTKANLNLMEEGRDSSIYDTITTYTGMMTSAKKDLPSSGTFKFFNSGQISEGIKNLNQFGRSHTIENTKNDYE